MKLEDRYGVEIPLYDLFLWGTPAAPLDKIDSAMNAGQDFIGNDLCNHYAFRQGTFDWQLWITTGNKPLPRKLVITNRADEARPQSVSLIDWNLKPTFQDAVFKFTPPKGAPQLNFVRWTKVKERHHEKVIQQVVPGSPDRSRSGQLRPGPGRRSARRCRRPSRWWWRWWWCGTRWRRWQADRSTVVRPTRVPTMCAAAA